MRFDIKQVDSKWRLTVYRNFGDLTGVIFAYDKIVDCDTITEIISSLAEMYGLDMKLHDYTDKWPLIKDEAIAEPSPPTHDSNAFLKDLAKLVHTYSLDTTANVPDFILASAMSGCVHSLASALNSWRLIGGERPNWSREGDQGTDTFDVLSNEQVVIIEKKLERLRIDTEERIKAMRDAHDSVTKALRDQVHSLKRNLESERARNAGDDEFSKGYGNQ